MTRRLNVRSVLLGALGLILLIVAAVTLSRSLRREPTPASPAILEHIAAKNDRAAAEAAANQKIESEVAAEAADRAIAANEQQ